MKQQPLLGFLFALTTAMAWGSLPLALKQVVAVMKVETIIWYRFMVATVALFLLLMVSKKLPKLAQFNRTYWWWTVFGVFGLAGNFFLFNTSLNYIEPAVTQIFIHLSSFAMLLLGVLVFKERLGTHQKIGLVLLIIGLMLFFNDRFDLFLNLNIYSIGVMLSVLAALVWVAYGLAQKMMLRQFTGQQILLLIYFGCAIVFTPFAEFQQVTQLTPFVWGCFIYCCLNTLIGYGAYAEALNRWDVSKVSVVVTLVPLFTILFSHILHHIAPHYFANPELNSLSYLGAFVVVLGSMLSAIGHKLFRQ
ncbi:transporter [Pasteurellaceae bacterium Pebbles2]|nr:transporter [Pasteurellaceae bacterium Pebbles2]